VSSTSAIATAAARGETPGGGSEAWSWNSSIRKESLAPTSFAHTEFNSVHVFRYVNANGFGGWPLFGSERFQLANDTEQAKRRPIFHNI
jgi:hypothetical protein